MTRLESVQGPALTTRAVTLGLAALGALVVANTAVCAPALRGLPAAPLVGEVVHDLAYLLAASLLVARVLLVRRDRPAWAMLAAGVACYGAADTFYFAVVQHLDPEPFPSLSDAGWLAFYPFAYACAALLLRARVRRWHASTWLDGLVASCGLGAVAVAGVLGRARARPRAPGGRRHRPGLPGRRPAAAGAARRGARDDGLARRRHLVAALAGLAWFILGDIAFLLQSASEPGYSAGGWVDVDLAHRHPADGAGGLGPQRTQRPAGRMDGWALLAVPLGFAAARSCSARVGQPADAAEPTRSSSAWLAAPPSCWRWPAPR